MIQRREHEENQEGSVSFDSPFIGVTVRRKQHNRKTRQVVKTGDSETAASNVTAWASVEGRRARCRKYSYERVNCSAAMTEDRDCVQTVCKFISHNSDRRQQPNISDTAAVEEPLAFSLFQQFTAEKGIQFSFLCSRELAKVEKIFQ